MKNLLKRIKSNLKLSNVIFRLICSWLTTFVGYAINKNINFNELNAVNEIKLLPFCLIFMIIFMIITVLLSLKKNTNDFDYYLCVIIFTIFSFMCVLSTRNMLVIMVLFLFFLLLYKYRLKDLKLHKMSTKSSTVIMILCGIMMFSAIAVRGVLSYKTFMSPNFDLGIPIQNFYYLKKVFIPLSTLERDTLLSHFAVHISPIYYLALPIYALFPKGETLQIVAALLIASTIIPIFLLCRHKKLPNYVTTLICLLFCFYAPAICSTFYDFHENLFLLPLLLWLFYFYEKEKNIPFIITMLLILFVKEDASIYVILFGIYMLFDKHKKEGIKTIIVGTAYFVLAIFILNHFGNGTMQDRYDNLITGDSGMIGIIKTILVNPIYFLTQLTKSGTNNSVEKIEYIIKLLLPLGFIPFKSNKYNRYLLLLPLLLTTMTTYQYMYNIDFHYSCGVIAFIIYLFILNIDENKNYNYLFVCLFGCIIIFANCVYPQIKGKIGDYQRDKQNYVAMEKMLSDIPPEASVNASAFLIPHLANRDTIYEVFYHNNLPDIEYVAFDARFDDYLDFYKAYLDQDYYVYKSFEKHIIILKKGS